MSEVPWQATVLSLFPEVFPGPLGASLIGKALAKGLWTLETVDIRAFAGDKHRTVDDSPFGGGPGMVMRADVLARAIDSVAPVGPRFYMSPRGRSLDQGLARDLAAEPGVLLVCGRFEGVDERVLEARGLTEISIGDVVLAGGEVAAMALLEATVRLLPGVLGEPDSLSEESFAAGLLEYPQYTRPRVWEGREVPEVLLEGDHARVAAWRQSAAETLTRERRPDLWRRYRGRQE